MKSSRQPNRKVCEAPQRQNKSIGSGIKKLVNRAADKSQKAGLGGKYTSGAPQLSATKLPNGGLPQTAKIPESALQTGQNNNSRKIKLQLFPLSESMRLKMEKDGYNPFLELTLSVKKKISSVIKHLNTKWGSSVVAKGELMLFPFNVLLENLASYSRWTQNSGYITAGEVHVAMGSPAVFRLRYGWISSNQDQSFAVPCQSGIIGASSESQSNKKGCNAFLESRGGRMEELEVKHEESPNLINLNEDCNAFLESRGGRMEELEVIHEESPNLININEATAAAVDQFPSNTAAVYMGDDVRVQTLVSWDDLTNLSIGGLLSEASLQGKNRNCDMTSNKNKTPLIQSSWDDNLTTLSIGGLLSEASLQGKINSSDPKQSGSQFSSKEALPISDSFDAFIFAQLNSNPEGSNSLNDSHPHSSILDAEETCHAFAFGKVSTSGKDPLTSGVGPGSSGCNNSRPKLFKFPETVENGVSSHAQDHFQEPKDMPRPRGIYDEDSSLGLSGIKWNDSRGPFDLGLPKSRTLINNGDSINISEFVR